MSRDGCRSPSSKGSPGGGYHLPDTFILSLVFVGFTALCWFDIKRRKRGELTWRTFARQVALSTVESLLALPFVAVFVALGFLVAVTALDGFHRPTQFLNNPIYYSVLYGPFSTIYFFTKRRCLTNKGPILPI